MNDAYRTDGITYAYDKMRIPALDHITFDIPEGSSTAVLGPNGAGKTTLMDILLRWKQPNSGTVYLFDTPINTYSKRTIGSLASLVPQDEMSRFSFTVLDYTMFGRSPYIHQLAAPTDEDARICLEALERTGIGNLAERHVSDLSGGERQLLLLARALAQKPKVLLLDEPTSSLDPGNTGKVVSILKELHSQGLTIVFTTHDPNLACELADRIAMIKHGRLLFCGPVASAMDRQRLEDLYGTHMMVKNIDGKLFVLRGFT